MTEPEQKYLNDLRESEFQAIDQFDKNLLALTGGAFGVSFAFLADVVNPANVFAITWLSVAWSAWCTALAAILSAFYCSHCAMRQAQRLFQNGERDEEKLQGRWGRTVMILNAVAGLSFLTGMVCMSVFVTSNLDHTEPHLKSSGVTATQTNVPSFKSQ